METTVFMNNKTQAVRIPKELAFPEDVKRVIARRQGNAIILTPAQNHWDYFFALPPLAGDFPDREQPEHQEREEF